MIPVWLARATDAMEALRAAGGHATPGRFAILQFLAEHDQPQTVEAIARGSLVAGGSPLSPNDVRRHVSAMAPVVEEVPGESGEPRFRLDSAS